MFHFKKFFFLIFAVLIFSATGCAFISIPLVPSTQPLHEEVISGAGKYKILVIDVSGIISEKKRSGKLGLSSSPSLVSRIKEEIEMASRDPHVKAVILKINSPGGTVTASDIIYNELIQFKKKTGKKVVAAMMDIAASGGYYIAAAADTIIAHPTTITGSIGVIAINLKIYELMNKVGITDATIKSGSKKDLMSPFRPSTEDERKILQGVIDTLHEQFVKIVTKGRKKLSIEEVRKIADGRIYTSKEALQINLIDHIGYLDDAIDLAKKEANIMEALIIRYARPFTYKNNLYSRLPDIPVFSGAVIHFDISTFLDNLTPRFMYLWMG